MIPRYSRPEMVSIWTDENRFKIWLQVELLALEQMANEGTVPKEAYEEVKAKANYDTERVLEIEKEVKHDVIAFLTNVAEYAGPASRFVHRGLTSSDLLDTTFAAQLLNAGNIILAGVDSLLEALRERAEEHKNTPCIGRSHGMHAEPTTFGLKLISWYAEVKRQRARLKQAIDEVAVGKIAGAVGTYASVTPTVEAHVLSSLGLKPETVASQIVHRDRHAAFFLALAQLGSSIEKFSVEVRHLQRTEVGEAREEFTKGQKGSSAMPHKKNPILSENLTGLARLLRGYSHSAMENVALWHERDISHSSVERMIAPDACVIADFMLARFELVVRGLYVNEERMLENLESSRGMVYSGTLLIALVDNGCTREDGYAIVQRIAFSVYENDIEFADAMARDEEVSKYLSEKDMSDICDLKRHLQYVDQIFDRAIAD